VVRKTSECGEWSFAVVIAADSPRDIVDMPSGPTEGNRMTCTFLLETADGAPADPPSFTTVARLWRAGDTIPLGRRTLRVVDVRETDRAP
jgi:hypothetical protein